MNTQQSNSSSTRLVEKYQHKGATIQITEHHSTLPPQSSWFEFTIILGQARYRSEDIYLLSEEAKRSAEAAIVEVNVTFPRHKSDPGLIWQPGDRIAINGYSEPDSWHKGTVIGFRLKEYLELRTKKPMTSPDWYYIVRLDVGCDEECEGKQLVAESKLPELQQQWQTKFNAKLEDF